MILLKSLKVKIQGSKISKTRAREGGASVFTSFLFSKAAASAKRAIQRAGKKEGGLGKEFLPARRKFWRVSARRRRRRAKNQRRGFLERKF